MAREYRHISADAHLVIPFERWTHRVPNKYHGSLPRRVRMPSGGDAYEVGGQRYVAPNSLFAGHSPEEYHPVGLTWDSPGTGPPEQRLAELDMDGIDAEVLFPDPGARRIWRSIEDKDAYRAVVRAYNEHLALEYCTVAPDRLVGAGVMPETGVDDAAKEMERCAGMGLKAINLAAFPSGRGYPTPDDDRFWAAAVDMNMPVTVHVAFEIRPGERGEPVFAYPRKPQEDMGAANFVERLARYGMRGGLNAVQLAVSGVFERFPRLRVYWAENQIGWIPIYLEQMDHNYKRHRYWAERVLGFEPLPRPPGEYIREHNFWGFFDDPIGLRLRHEIGVDRIMWGSDFPHAESDWPRSLDVLAERFAGVPEEERYRIVAGNAVEFFHLESASPRPGSGLT